MNWNIDFAQGLACDRSIGCQVNHFRKGLEPYNHNNLLTLDLSMNVLPPLVCKFHQGQCLPFPIDIKPIPATSLPAQAAQARLAQLQANMGGLQGLAVGPQLGGLPNINFHFSCALYIRLISPKQVVALRSRFDSTTSCGGIHARFCRGGAPRWECKAAPWCIYYVPRNFSPARWIKRNPTITTCYTCCQHYCIHTTYKCG